MKINGYRNRSNGQVIQIDPIEAQFVDTMPGQSEWEPVWITINIESAVPAPESTPATEAAPVAPAEESGANA